MMGSPWHRKMDEARREWRAEVVLVLRKEKKT
jgi:hypothetical protein